MSDTTTHKTTATIMCPFCLTMNRVELARSADAPTCDECAKPLLLDRPIKVTDESFQATIEGTDVPIVVDFHADWCQPCKMMAPLLDQLAADMQGEVLVAKLDTDANPDTSVEYGIRSIPTLVVFRDGREWKRQTGLVPPETLAELLEIEVEIDDAEGE